MNTIKKIGLTALGTTLVASSAFAGEISVSGDAGYTWSTEDMEEELPRQRQGLVQQMVLVTIMT